MATDTIHIMQASLQVHDPTAEIRSDVVDAFDAEPADLYGITEVPRGSRARRVLVEEAKARGITLVLGDDDTAVATRHRVVASGHIPVHGPDLEGRDTFPRRGITWATAKVGDELVTLHEAHWLAHLAGAPERRLEAHEAMTRAMIRAVKSDRASGGRRIAVFAGDTNVDEARDLGSNREFPDFLFDRAGLRTVWDELGIYLNTHGSRTIDVVGTLDDDRRVSAESVRVWRRRFADHARVSVYLRIRP